VRAAGAVAVEGSAGRRRWWGFAELILSQQNLGRCGGLAKFLCTGRP
jgi:hypothetical protein